MSSSITCGNCKSTHYSVEGVRRCYAGQAGPCSWQSYARDRWGYLTDEDGARIVLNCDALAWDNGRAFVCEAGHEHVWAQNRADEGWEYAEDADEARTLAKAGVMPVGMDGGSISY
jgi:hypothetical protein